MRNEAILDQAPYALGHSPAELERLNSQSRFFGDLTVQVLQLAGIGPGMKVLDIGCGSGGTTFLAAQLVGPKGHVTGVDKAPEAIAMAKQRAASAGISYVDFVTADLSNYRPDSVINGSMVDALIGTRVLMYFRDPAVLLRRLAECVRPKGIIAFQEFDLYAVKSEPFCLLYEQSIERVRQVFTRAGADNCAGLKLAQIFEEAGLPTPQMIQGARVEKGPDSELYNQVAQVSRSLLPLIERFEVAKAEEVGIETLAERLSEEAVALNATLVGPPMIGAWTRKRG